MLQSLALCLTLSASAVVLARAAQPANAAPPMRDAPIDLHVCRIQWDKSTNSSKAVFEFINRRMAAADEVRFTVTYDQTPQTFTDRGTFSHGVAIWHTFPARFQVLLGRVFPESCAVDYAHFSDGTDWIRRR